MSITENFSEVGSLVWFYREAVPAKDTDKSPVIMLHGIPSQSLSWCELMPKLAEFGFRAIAPDWIGFGFSSKTDKRDFAYTPDAYIKALEDFLASLEIEHFSLVVQGFLGSVGIQYALRHPEQIDRLIILNTPLSPEDKLPWKMKQWGIPLVGEMLTQDPLLVDRTLEGGSGFVVSDQNLDIYRKPFLTTSAAGRSLQATIKNLKLPEAMTEINTGLTSWHHPTLIVWGCGDPWLSVSTAEQLANSQKEIELVKLEEAKHYPQEHWSTEISENILNFLRRQAL